MKWQGSFFWLVLVCVLAGVVPPTFAQNPAKSKVLWLTLDEAVSKSTSEKRKVMVFFYTDWCNWCQKMEKITLNDSGIADYINRNYLPVKFNAEERESLKFKSKTYSFVSLKPKGVHGFAMEAMGGRISFPTITFFDENWEVIQSIPNFQSPEKFSQILAYFAENYFKRVPWSTFQNNFQNLDAGRKN